MRRTTLVVPLSLLSIAFLSACSEDLTRAPAEPTEPEVEETGPVPPSLDPLSTGVEGYSTPGELRAGYIYDRAGEPLEITYEIHDGLAIWQGDIVIGTPDQIATSPAELPMMENGPLLGVVIDDNSRRWPGGVIPYTITDATTSIVMDAIEIIEDQTPGVTLIPQTTETNYVTFRDAGGCSSKIGMEGGQQFINLKVNDGVSFCSAGNAAHEILHALGMYHEHTRCDRDNFVTIDYDEIESGKEGNFYKAGSGSENGACSGAFDIDAYDPGSMMHYGQFAFAIGSNPTIIPKAGVDGSAMGQRSAVGPTDAETIDQLYGTNNDAPTVVLGPLQASYPEGSPVPFDASASTDADDDDDILTFAWIFGDGTCPVGASCSDPAPPHTYADNGNYGYSVTVSDGFDASAAGSSIDITNVAPTVSAGSDATIDEGDEFTRSGSFTDLGADTWSATVDYDDGAGPEVLSLTGMSFSLAHTYADDGTNTVMVSVTDDDGGNGTDDVKVTVLNVAPTVEAGPDATVDSGETFNFSGSFSDPGVNDNPWGWVIDWGFGPNSSGSTDDQSAAIQASRQVCVAGDYTVQLTVTDKDGGEGSDQMTLSVPYIPVDIDIMPGTDVNPVNIGRRGLLPVAILGSFDFDVADVDPSTLILGDETGTETAIAQKNNGTYQAAMEDVNEDGFMDLVVRFHVQDLAANGDIDEFSTELVLRGFESDGCTNLRGSDSVTPITK
jgi:hypothetical protein